MTAVKQYLRITRYPNFGVIKHYGPKGSSSPSSITMRRGAPYIRMGERQATGGIDGKGHKADGGLSVVAHGMSCAMICDLCVIWLCNYLASDVCSVGEKYTDNICVQVQ